MPGDQFPAAQVERLAATGRRVETPCGGGSMVWRLWGEGTPLVLLHGGFGSWTHWFRNIPDLAQRYRLIVANLPGLGESDDAPPPPPAQGPAPTLPPRPPPTPSPLHHPQLSPPP